MSITQLRKNYHMNGGVLALYFVILEYNVFKYVKFLLNTLLLQPQIISK